MTPTEAKELTLKNLEGESGATDNYSEVELLGALEPYCDLNEEQYPHDSDTCGYCPVRKICCNLPDTFEELRKQVEGV